MGIVATERIELTNDDFRRISDLVRSTIGINLHDGKRELVKARLAKRLRHLRIGSFEGYMSYLENDTTGVEMVHLMDVISTNLTSFFREADHFDYLSQNFLPDCVKRGQTRLRFWSAGCSSGEEPYTLAMTIRESLGELASRDARILATDISTIMLGLARQGQYAHRHVRAIPAALLGRYFTGSRRLDGIYTVNESLRSMIHFARLNLMESWPMQGPFDAIFCRNVMIYFDKITQQGLIERYSRLLAPGGLLFIGHSESLAGIQHKLQYVQPAVYQKR
ncbi:MAG: protein-glutamate O-methyltransferase CheR [Planctomycetaceae bacterium]|nr:MAG: protein-glutamate O-methyltransferase CheR [Planctomycetaceae bacterium]